MTAFFLFTVLPFLGTLTTLLITLSPLQAVQQSLAMQSLQGHNVLPYPMMTANSLGWIFYGLLVRDWYVLISNVAGFLFGLYYSMIGYMLAANDARMRPSTQPVWIMRLLLGGCGVALAGASIAFLHLPGGINDLSAQQYVMGLHCVTLLVLFYMSPLSELFHYPLLLACLANGLLWAWYGYALQDGFISGPNWVGVAVGCVQLACKVAFTPRDGKLMPI